MQSIISYNVNGIRSAFSKGFIEWLEQEQPDVIGIQETKAQPEDIDKAPLEALGYHHYWHSAEKKGYSGVAILCKKEPDLVVEGSGIARYDAEGRIIRADFGDWTVVNCYFPSGTTGDIRQAVKMDFLFDFGEWIAELRRERPNLIIIGDYNIANHPIDIHDPKGNKNTSGFLPDERAWLTEWFDTGGFTDAYRQLHPEKVEYSWWSFRAGARKNNKGWRIDYQSVANVIAPKLVSAEQLTDIVHSDHCPVKVVIDL